MNEPDHELAGRVAGYLKEGARNLEPAVVERLLAARKAALARYQVATQPAWGWTWATQAVGRLTNQGRPGAMQMLIAGAALVAALIGLAYWQNYSGLANELAEVDAELLTDELPIHAYLDKGFDSWLRRSSR